MSHTLHMDYPDKDSIQHTKSLVLFSLHLLYELRQFRFLKKAILPTLQFFVSNYFPILKSAINFIVKKNSSKTFIWVWKSAGQSGPLASQCSTCSEYRRDETGCQHSRRAFSATVDYSTSERLPRYSNVLETISKD